MKIAIHKIEKDIVRIPTSDEYNKADYKWDPTQEKTIYIGHKKKSKIGGEESQSLSKQPQIKKQSLIDKIKKMLIKTNYSPAGYVEKKKMQNQIKDIWANSGEDEKDTVISYTGFKYRTINKALRKKMKNPYTDEAIENINKMIDKFKLPYNLKVFRGQTNIHEVKDFDTENLKTNIGKVVHFESYVSTSLNKQAASDFLEEEKPARRDSKPRIPVLYTINLPKKKTKGAYLNGYSKYSGEEEFLLQNNQNFIIKTVKKKKTYESNKEFYEIELDKI